MEVLSEHLCQGWLEGYLLTGRHGLFSCYEAFIHIVDSMFNQHAKWLKVTREIPWRRPIASLTTCSRRTSGGRTTTASPIRTRASSTTSSTRRPSHPRLPAAGRQHAALGGRPLPAQPRLRQRHRGRQAAGARYLSMDEAVAHCTRGLGIWEWASNDAGESPTSSWPAPATSRRWRPWRRSACCASTCPT